MTGEVGILNVGAGDTKLSFDPAKPAEAKRAAATVTDMLQRGYAIFVQIGTDEKGPVYRRAESFDPATNEYLIIGLPEDQPTNEQEQTSPPRRSGKSTSTRARVPAAATNSIAVARTAGG